MITDPELLNAVTTIVSLTGDENDFNLFKNKFRNANTPQNKLRYLLAVANFLSAELVRNTCEFAFSNEVKTQDVSFLLNRAVANHQYGGIAWNFIKENIDKINITEIANIAVLNTPEQFADVKDFFNKNKIQSQKLDQILEVQSINVDLRLREETRLINAFST